MDIGSASTWVVANKDVIGLVVFAVVSVSGSARGAIAAANEIMQSSTMSNDQALQKASDLMGKYWPFIPDGVRKWIIQRIFNSMKKSAVAKK